MAIAVSQHATAHATSTATTASVTTASSGSAFLIFIAYDSTAANLSSVGDNKGNTYSVVQAKFNGTSSGGDVCAIACYGVANAAGGSGHTFTATSSSSFLSICAVEITGGATTLALLTDAIAIAADGTSPYLSGNVTLAQAGELLLSFIGSTIVSGTKTITAGNSFNSLDTQGDSTWYGAGLAWKAGPGAGGSDGGSWTISGANEGTAVMTIALKPPAGAVATGSSMTASSGTAALAVAMAVTGSASSAASGTAGIDFAVAAAGSSATAATGDGAPLVSASVGGSGASASGGSVGVSMAVAALGSEATAVPGDAGGWIEVVASGSQASASSGSATGLAIAVDATGTAATAVSGIVSVNGSQSVAATGSSATAVSGDSVPTFAVAATGSQASISSGNVDGPGVSVPAIGEAATAQSGDVGKAMSVAATGSFATAVSGQLPLANILPHLVAVAITSAGPACLTTVASIGVRGSTTITELD